MGSPLKKPTVWLVVMAIVATIFIGAWVYIRMREGVTPLMLAARSGDNTKLRRLLEKGVEIDKQSRYGWTALMFAAWQGHEKSVQILLDAGADPNINSETIPSRFETVGGHPPSSALQEAVRNGYPRIARILIRANATIEPKAIALAGREGLVDLLKHFKELGIDVDQPSGSAFYPTPLIAAAENGELATVKWLVEQGADPNKIVYGYNALKDAIEKDHVEVVWFLLEQGADANLVCGSSPGTQEGMLFAAATKPTHNGAYVDNLAIIELLLECGADPSQTGFSESYTTLGKLAIIKEYAEERLREEVKDEYIASARARLDHINATIELIESYQRASDEKPID